MTTPLPRPALRLALAALACAALLGCEPEVPGVVDGTCDPGRRDEVTSQEYFDTVMVPQIFEPHCSRCHWSDKTGAERHGAPVSVDYDTPAAAGSRASSTWFRVSTYDMPPMGVVPTLDEMATLNEWLNCALDAATGDDDDSAN
jgi:mono/diheme cytochrome c family protein